MRYAIVSDLHANLRAWHAVLADLCEQGADVVVCLGDVVGYGPNPAEVLDAVRSVTNNFVMGNHDAAAVGMMDYSIFNDHARQAIEWTMTALNDEAKQFLSSVPLAIEAGEILFVHAEISEPGRFDYISDAEIAKENFKANNHLVTFVGHTHLPKIFEQDSNGNVQELPDNDAKLQTSNRYIVNVGSVGEPRDSDDLRARYVIYDSESRDVIFRRVEFDIPSYRNDLQATTLALRPFFLRVYEHVTEGRDGNFSSGGSLVDMKVSHDSASLVDLGQVSGVANLCSSGELLQSAQPSRAPTVILSVIAVLTLGLLAIWMIPGRKAPPPPPRVTETKPEEKPPAPPKKIVPEEVKTPKPKEPVIVKTPPKPEPKPQPKPKPPEPKPQPKPAPIDSQETVEVAWWRMGDDSEGDTLVDKAKQVTFLPVKAGNTIKALAPDPIPANQVGNNSAKQLGIWQEEAPHDHFALTKDHSFTFEGWFFVGSFRKPVFLFGTRSGEDDRSGWHLDLRPRSRGQQGQSMSFFYDSGDKQTQAIATDLELDKAAHHFAIVWDHDTSSDIGKMKVFLDGSEVASASLPHAQIIGKQTHPFRIGAPFNPAKLGLDELRFTRRTLQPHEFLIRTAVKGVTLIQASGPSTDSWSIPENWDGGKIPGRSDNVIIGPGLRVQINKEKPTPFSGSLVLKKGASIHLWTGESEVVLPKDDAKLIMYSDSQLILRSQGSTKLGPIELVEKANIFGGISTSGHRTIRSFTSKITGSGQLILHGTNGGAFSFEAASPFTGGIVTQAQGSHKFKVVCAADGCLGKGRVVIKDHASLRIQKGLTNTISDSSGLILSGSKGILDTKLVLDSDETVGRFVIDGEDQGVGVFDKKSHPETISGDGKLTVE